MKRAKRVISLYLAVLLLGMNILPVFAAENPELPVEEAVQQETEQNEDISEAETTEESSDSDVASDEEVENTEVVSEEEAEDDQVSEELMLPEEETEKQSQPEAMAVQLASNERLDGDYAYISDAKMVGDQESFTGCSIRTGTAPWDGEDEADEAGNDATPFDAKVRSFDLVSYTTCFQTKMRGNAPCANYCTGTLHFEFVLPGASSEIQFETESMGWLSAKKEAQYTITEEEWQGKSCQVLRGSYLLEPNEKNENAIGESYQELSIMIRVLAMKNGTSVQPFFTYWLDHCQVPEGGMVTGSGAVCAEHQEQEYKTITPPPVTVTAAPRYNIQIKTCDERAQYVDNFCFNTGNSYAMNQDAGAIYGRIHVLGITIQMVGKTAEQGLRGCELPDGNALGFQINLTSEFCGNNGESHTVTDTYTPLVWSMEGNNKNDHTKQQYDERIITGAYKFAAGGAPFNKDNYDYYTCADGGIWTGSQKGNTVFVQVSGYSIDLNRLPYTDSNSNQSKYVYYDPNSIKNYWNVQNACFSAGELWVVQPFYDKDGSYVVDQYGTGTFNLTVQDSGLQINGQQAAAEYLEKNPMSLNDEDYIQYMQKAFPSRSSGKQLSYENDYPDAFWVNNTETEDGLANYKKAEYGTDGYQGGSAGVSYGDSCLVVSFTTKITKAVLQRNSNGTEKLAYDMDASQRVADYALYLSTRRTAGEATTEEARIITDLYIEDTLPAGLTYLGGTASWGGTYAQTKEGQQGTVTGGTAMEPDIVKNGDGTTTLRWTLKDVVVTEEETMTFAPIYYSCLIGTPEDVKNNDQLLNKAIIWGSKEQKRDFNAANENLAELSIQVSKNNVISISKTTRTPLVEAGEPMEFTLNIGNNAANEMEIIALDGLPYNGDGRGTAFSGDCQVTEMTVKNLDLLDGIEVYYSDQESDRGKVSANYAKTDFQGGNWKKLTVDNATGEVTLPRDFKPVAVAAVGMLPAQETLKIDLTMLLPDGKTEDRAVNSLSCKDLETQTGNSVVSRLLEGIVWLDKDRDGIRTEEETSVDGVKVTLMKLKDGGDPSKMEDYEPYILSDGNKAEIESGQQMDLRNGTATSYEDGRYLFSGLPEGTFGVLFADGTFDIYGYQASPKDSGEDDTVDSDGAPSYKNEELEMAWIGEIKMPSKDEMKTPEYRSAYHDLGLYVPETVPDTGVGLSSDRRFPVWFLAGSILLLGAGLIRRRKQAKR